MPGSKRTLPPAARGLLAATFALACLALAQSLAPSLFARLELAAADLRLRLSPRPLPSPDVVLLDIDDATVKRYGPWPLPRGVHARVLDVLTDCGVSVVGYDIVFRGAAAGEAPLGTAAQGDDALETAIRRSGRVVLPVGVDLVREAEVLRLSPEADDLPLLPSLLAPTDSAPALHIPSLLQVERTVLPAARFSRPALGLGHIAATPDEDGAYRRMPLVVGYHGQALPALGLTLAARHMNATAVARPGAVELLWPGGSRTVPTDAQGMLIVNPAAYWGHGFWHLSYAELLDAAESAAQGGAQSEGEARLEFLRQGLKGKMVLVGLVASGTTDIKPTALSPAEPLVTLHANLVSQLLTSASLRVPPDWASPAFAAVFLALTAMLFLRLPIRSFLPASLGVVVLCPATNLLLYRATGLGLNITATTLAVCVGVLALLVDGLARTARDSARQRRVLATYFSPSIARQILETGEDIMTGRSVDCTVLFADIAGFTAMSDHMEPAEVQRFLGEYFEEMTACVFRNAGAVDKFMGDGLMSFFGYPETPGVDSQENARLSAIGGVRAAVEMQAAVERLNLRWKSQGRRQIAIRIGLNTGHAIVGDMGSASRREFTLLGRTVNLAQRLESAAPPGGVLLSARTATLVSRHFRLEAAGSLKLKGFDKEEEAMTVDLPKGAASD